MTDEQRAIELLTDLRNPYCSDEESTEKKLLEIAIEAVNKQIPKKCEVLTQDKDVKVGTITFKKGTKTYKCGACGELVTKHIYCPECGQKLEWEE